MTSPSNDSSRSGVVQALFVWLAWFAAGVFVLGVPDLLRQGGGLLDAIAIASGRIKILFAIWVLGSVILFALVLIAIQRAAGRRPNETGMH